MVSLVQFSSLCFSNASSGGARGANCCRWKLKADKWRQGVKVIRPCRYRHLRRRRPLGGADKLYTYTSSSSKFRFYIFFQLCFRFQGLVFFVRLKFLLSPSADVTFHLSGNVNFLDSSSSRLCFVFLSPLHFFHKTNGKSFNQSYIWTWTEKQLKWTFLTFLQILTVTWFF
jgi:hypothetical protein